MSIMRRDDGTQTVIGGILSILWLLILLVGLLIYYLMSKIGSIPTPVIVIGVIGIALFWSLGYQKNREKIKAERLEKAREIRARKSK